MLPIFESFQNILFIQIGCGGTGGWLVPNLSKFIDNVLHRVDTNIKGTPRVKYVLVDHDRIELRNTVRQNFSEYEIEQNKARMLALRYCSSSLHLTYINQPFDLNDRIINTKITNTFVETEYQKNSLIVFIGCVDDVDTRLNIYKLFKRTSEKYYKTIKSIYFDSGNDLYHGQLFTCWSKNLPQGVKYNVKGHKNFIKFFKKMRRSAGEEVNTQSCAFFGEQTQSLNNLAASILFCHIQNLLINCELPPSLINFNSMGYSTYKM